MKKEQLEILISALNFYIFATTKKEKKRKAKKLIKIFRDELRRLVDNSGS